MLELIEDKLSEPDDDDTAIPKYRRVYQKVSQSKTSVSQQSSSGKKFLEDITYRPAKTPTQPLTSTSTLDATTHDDNEITPKRRKKNKIMIPNFT